MFVSILLIVSIVVIARLCILASITHVVPDELILLVLLILLILLILDMDGSVLSLWTVESDDMGDGFVQRSHREVLCLVILLILLILDVDRPCLYC